MHHAITGSAVELSAPTVEDVPAIAAACQDPAIAAHTTIPFPYTADDARAFVAAARPAWEAGNPVWAIRVADELAGMIDLHGSDGDSAEIGYWMTPAHRGRGHLTEAVGLVVDHGFARGLRRIQWRAVVGNWASWKPAWRHGFRREGVLRACFADRRDPAAPWRDMWVGALLDTDPREPATRWDGPLDHHPAIPDPRDPDALVRQFHATYHLPVATGPADVAIERVHMRMALIAEEFAELMGAVYGDDAEQLVLAAVTEAVASDTHRRDTVAAADAMADLVYVIYGMALETGIPLDAVLHAVQRSNMSKLGEDGMPIYRADGKVLKGPGFFNPDIAAVLASTRVPGL